MTGGHGTGIAGSRPAQVGSPCKTGRDISRRDHALWVTAARRGNEAHCPVPAASGAFRQRATALLPTNSRTLRDQTTYAVVRPVRWSGPVRPAA